MRHARGFTLLELLVAMAVFALLSMMAYGGLRSVLTAKQHTDVQAQRLVEVQRAVLLLSRDLAQWSPREIRDEYGDRQPALRGGNRVERVLELSRDGRPNPAGQLRSSLQRIAYRADGGVLVRESWAVLDRAQDSLPYRSTLLDGVQSLSVRFLSPSRAWLEEWPPLTPDDSSPGVPLAVEVTLELEDWDRITRLYRLPESG